MVGSLIAVLMLTTVSPDTIVTDSINIGWSSNYTVGQSVPKSDSGDYYIAYTSSSTWDSVYVPDTVKVIAWNNKKGTYDDVEPKQPSSWEPDFIKFSDKDDDGFPDVVEWLNGTSIETYRSVYYGPGWKSPNDGKWFDNPMGVKCVEEYGTFQCILAGKSPQLTMYRRLAPAQIWATPISFLFYMLCISGVFMMGSGWLAFCNYLENRPTREQLLDKRDREATEKLLELDPVFAMSLDKALLKKELDNIKEKEKLE